MSAGAPHTGVVDIDDVSAVVLAGGASRRFGSDKLAAPLGGTTVLDLLLGSLPARWPVVVVGSERPTVRPVTWASEDPPGGGPLAGVEAGLAVVATGLVVVVAGDMPYAGAAVIHLVATLRAQPPEVAAVVANDDSGHANPLLAAYRTAAVRQGLPRSARNRPAKLLLTLPHTLVAVTGRSAHDVDTRNDLEALDRLGDG